MTWFVVSPAFNNHGEGLELPMHLHCGKMIWKFLPITDLLWGGVTSGFSSQRASNDVRLFSLNKSLNKQSSYRWLQSPCRLCDIIEMMHTFFSAWVTSSTMNAIAMPENSSVVSCSESVRHNTLLCIHADHYATVRTKHNTSGVYTETERLSFWWNFRHWLHRKL